MKSCLIVYYSRSGVTDRVARALALACGADLERIRDVRPRTGPGGYLRSAWQALRGLPDEIAAPLHDPSAYELVVLGTPVWAGHMSAPMRGYILCQREHFHRVAMFCTMGGSGGQNTVYAMAELCDKFPAASLCLRQQEVLAGRDAAAVAGFAAELTAAGSATPWPPQAAQHPPRQAPGAT